MTQLAEPPPTLPAAEQEPPRPIYGVIGEYDDVTSVKQAACAFRDAGFKRWDVYSPFPIHGIEKAMGSRMTVLPWIILVCGLTGMISGVALTIFTMATDFGIPFLPGSGDIRGYKYLISGKPFDSFPAFIPPIFELTILLSAFGAVFGMFLLNKLPLLAHPLFRSDRFRRVTSDRFFIGVEARDERYDQDQIMNMFQETGALSTEVIEQ